MKTIPTTWTKNGFLHSVLMREGDVLLVRRQHRDVSDPHWEVVKIRVEQSKRLPDGRVLEEREVYPASEQWGAHGWTFKDLDRAKAKFKEVAP